MHRRTGVSMARSEQLATTEVLEPPRHDLWDPLKRTQDPPAAAHRMRCGSQCGAKRALSSVRVSTRQRVRLRRQRSRSAKPHKHAHAHQRSRSWTNGSRRHGNSSAHGLLQKRRNSAEMRRRPPCLHGIHYCRLSATRKQGPPFHVRVVLRCCQHALFVLVACERIETTADMLSH